MKKYAVIVAGGSGVRMGTSMPKQFLLIHGRPLLWYSLQVFLMAFPEIEIILVLPPEYDETGRSIVDSLHSLNPTHRIEGGPTRFQSVRNGLTLVQEPSMVFIHDGVRCLLSPALIHRCFEAAQRFGSAVPSIDCRDSVRIISDTGNRPFERSQLKLLQTPQTFLSELLLPAYQKDYQESFTDDASVVEYSGHPIHLVEGEINNIKITTPLDLVIAEKLLDLTQSSV